MGIRRAQKRHESEEKRRSTIPPARSVPSVSGTQSVPADLNSGPEDLPEELIAARAYEKWRLRGCPMGQDSSQDWYAARAELEAERLGWAAPQAGDDKRSAKS